MLTLWRDENRNHQMTPVERFFDDVFNDVWAPSRAWQNDGTVIKKLDDGTTEISVPLPGMQKSDVEVTVEGGRLTVAAEAKEESRARSFVSKFTRSWTLGPQHDGDKIDAAMAEGVLTVTVPPSKEARAKTIKIR